MAIDYDRYVYDLCHHMGIHPRDVLGDNRFHNIHEVRQIVYLMLSRLGLKNREIALIVQRDRTTVLHGLRIVQRKMNEPHFAEKVKRAEMVSYRTSRSNEPVRPVLPAPA